MFGDAGFAALLSKGGFTVIVLGALSIVSIALMLERLWAFRRFERGLRVFFAELSGAVDAGGAAAGARLCGGSSSPLARVYLAGFRKRGRLRDEVIDAMELAGRAELTRLERFLGVLGTIGSISPFIGLFGTVLGIIRAFSDLSVAHGASPAAVADGIAEALVATAAGLFVAIPAVAAYNFFARSASRRALELETYSTEFAGALVSAGEERDGLEAKG